uniref:hypothetical protein n=1 Tax=Altererythrobacter segetis TaxID=1104773 RepID=UPI00140C22F7|nr:hypothetical protein [Altererythrobacter segetis]
MFLNRMWIACALLSVLAACGTDEANQAHTVSQLDAQPITYMDIEAAKLAGPSCNYAAGKSMGAVVMAMDDAAVMKLGGALKRFTLDPQCDKLEKGTGSRYVAPGYVLDLAIKSETRSEAAGKLGFEGSVKLSDGKGRVLYSTAGDVQCGG